MDCALQIHVSLVLNLHREGRYLPRTLMSLKEAADFARGHGIVVELVAVLDRVDDATRNVLTQFDLAGFDHVQIIETDQESLGLARNIGCAHARGRYVGLFDGDDLISFTSIAAMYHEAELRGPNAILVAEWLLAFGERYFFTQYLDLDFVTPLSFLDTNPYGSTFFFPRDLFQLAQFSDLRLTEGYAYEDWHFNAEAVALGYRFYVAPGTLRFYRRRRGGLRSEADRISVGQIPPSRLFLPETFVSVCAASYDKLLAGKLPKPRLKGRDYLDDAACRSLIAAANRIEPAIEPDAIKSGSEHLLLRPSTLAIGKRYFEICERIGKRTFTDIFILPFFDKGGAERYIANLIRELKARRDDISVLVILGEPHPTNEWLTTLPSDIVTLDLAPWLGEIGERGVDLITLKLVQSVGPAARLHVRTSVFGKRFLMTYGRALSTNKRLYYRFSQEMRQDRDADFAIPGTFQFVSENLEHIDLVISDNHRVIDFDRRRMGVTPDKWQVLPTLFRPVMDRLDATNKAARASNRILWASRMSAEKRPEVLFAVARELRAHRRELILEIHGSKPPDVSNWKLRKLRSAVYRGPYDKFEEIAASDFICFIYTSLFDGIPTVLMEATGMGLPIVAPDVGAIGEFIEDGKTGILLPSVADAEVMARAYVEAIIRVQRDPALRRRLVGGAYDRILAQHGPSAYGKALDHILELVER